MCMDPYEMDVHTWCNFFMWPNLGNLGSSKSEALSLASNSAAPLDSRQAPASWTGCIRKMLPLLSGAGDDRPHRRVMLVLEANLVEYSLHAWRRRLTGRRGLHPILVAWSGKKRKGADSLFLLVAWELWKKRNARCSRDKSTNTMQPKDQWKLVVYQIFGEHPYIFMYP